MLRQRPANENPTPANPRPAPIQPRVRLRQKRPLRRTPRLPVVCSGPTPGSPPRAAQVGGAEGVAQRVQLLQRERLPWKAITPSAANRHPT